MGTLYIRQSNGKLTLFSTISDYIEAYDMTDKEAIEYAGELARKNAMDATERLLKELKPGVSNHFRLTLKEAVESTIKRCPDLSWVKEVKKLLQENANGGK